VSFLNIFGTDKKRFTSVLETGSAFMFDGESGTSGGVRQNKALLNLDLPALLTA
jgi:hypothetical protein